jgi:cardiolipin synthase
LYFNYRTHQKILVIDGNIGYTGGMNIADEYANISTRFGKWKDTAVRIEGEAVFGLTMGFLQMWDISGKGPSIEYDKYKPSVEFEENDTFCHILTDGPANNPENPIEDMYRHMITTAKEYIYITTPYLVIEENMINELVIAAVSGIDVRIMTPYIPDKKSIKLITNYNYGRLLKAGVKIYEYKLGFIHAKSIVNETSAIVGSINMDYRSFYLHYERGAWMCDKKIVNTIRQDFLKTVDESIEIKYEDWKNRPIYMKLFQSILNLFQTLL